MAGATGSWLKDAVFQHAEFNEVMGTKEGSTIEMAGRVHITYQEAGAWIM